MEGVHRKKVLSMKLLGVRSKFLALSVALGLSGVMVSQQALAVEATVTDVSGPVIGAQKGGSLPVGHVITTQSNGEVVLDVAGHLVVVAENSILKIEELKVETTGIEKITEVTLALSQGRVYGEVEKSSKLSQFTVKIPKGHVAIDATESAVVFDISASGHTALAEGTASVVVNRGTNEAPNMVVQEIKSEQRFDAGTGVVSAIDPTVATALTKAVSTKKAGVASVVVAEAPENPFNFFISPNLPLPPSSSSSN